MCIRDRHGVETPVTHVYNHDGRRWLGKMRKDLENSESVPLEILEDQGERGIVRKVYKGLGSVKEGPLAIEAQRRKTLSVLWAKFGRYMCQSLDGDIGVGEPRGENFVRFYQRIGTVGMWVFADGCMQVSIPFPPPQVQFAAVLTGCTRRSTSQTTQNSSSPPPAPWSQQPV